MDGQWLFRLKLFLRISAAVLMCALAGAVLPVSAMRAVHDTMGIGAFPDGPIVVYLARSASLLYAFHGVLLLYISFDVGRNLRLLRFLAGVGLLFGMAMFFVDRSAGLPLSWACGETVSIVFINGVIVWLVSRVAAETSGGAGEASKGS